MTSVYAVFIALFIVCLAIRDVYERLKEKGRVDPADTRVFAVVFSSMCVMWVSWFGMGFAAPERFALPVALRWSGLAAVVAGAVLAVGGMWSLRGVENIDHLVTTGLFSKFRHPMYLGFMLWVVGWVVYVNAPTNVLLAPFGLASIAWWRRLEERDLESRYGEAYVSYRATTWA